MSERNLPPNERLMLALSNQNEGLKAFCAVIDALPDGKTNIRSSLVEAGKTNFEISQQIHEDFGISLEPSGKMSPGYHINVVRRLRNIYFDRFDQTDAEILRAYEISLSERTGFDHPHSKIKPTDKNFDEVIEKIKEMGESGSSFVRIGKELIEVYGIPFNHPRYAREIILDNQDIFGNLADIISQNSLTKKAERMIELSKRRAHFLVVGSPTFDEELERVESLRIDDKKTWNEINIILGGENNESPYKDDVGLRNRMRSLRKSGHFIRLTDEVEKSISKELQSGNVEKAAAASKILTDVERNAIYDMWKKEPDTTTKKDFCARLAKEYGVSVSTVKRITLNKDRVNRDKQSL